MYEPFYIGKGKDSRYISHLRNYKLKKNDSFLSRKINKILKNGCSPYITKLYENLTEKEAHSIEIELIDIIGRRCVGKGSLVNITCGGEGISGFKHSDETREKMSLKGEKHPNWGKPRSKETRNKISKALTLNNPMHNPLVVEKVRLQNLGKTPWNKGLSASDVSKKRMSESKQKYVNIRGVSKKTDEEFTFGNTNEVMYFLSRTHRMVMIYFDRGESKDYWWSFDKLR